MVFFHRFNTKPKGKEIGWIQKELKEAEITIEQLAAELVNGACFRPGVLRDGRKASNWKEQQLFGLDFDNGATIDSVVNKSIQLGMKPCFVYTTFSHKEEHHKFRIIYCTDAVITDADTRDKLQATLMGAIGGVDEVCFNRDRVFFGGKGKQVLYANFDSRINADEIINAHWKTEYSKYITGSNTTKKPNKAVKSDKGTNTKDNNKKALNRANTEPQSNNIDAISKLDVTLMKDRLGKKWTDNKDSYLSVYFYPPSPKIFSSEAEMYEFINAIDLKTYLGVTSNMFKCILPGHEDSKASAHIYITDSGTQVYKCFGCNQCRTIISITEQLSGCKRHEAIEFIKSVFSIDYRPSEWVEKQRQIMIDSALYLDSEEFLMTFPELAKLSRTRKVDLQKILLHMTKFINEDLQYDGKPLFYASNNSLMQICDIKSKARISQTLTLFALLNMLTKVESEHIPESELKKAKDIAAKHGFKKLTSFYQVEEYGYNTLAESEEIARVLTENNMTLKGLSREYVLRTFGKQTADKVFPQYKVENEQGTSDVSDKRTLELAKYLTESILENGYMLEKDLNQNNFIGIQWKRSIQELLTEYGLKRVKLNNELKEKYHITCKGYPYIIVEDENKRL